MGGQHDVHEFFIGLFNGLHEALLAVETGGRATHVSTLFRASSSLEYRCTTCGLHSSDLDSGFCTHVPLGAPPHTQPHWRLLTACQTCTASRKLKAVSVLIVVP
jgi:hypothetical protein